MPLPSSSPTTAAATVNVTNLRRTIRLIHCLQKERGATCTASEIISSINSNTLTTTTTTTTAPPPNDDDTTHDDKQRGDTCTASEIISSIKNNSPTTTTSTTTPLPNDDDTTRDDKHDSNIDESFARETSRILQVVSQSQNSTNIALSDLILASHSSHMESKRIKYRKALYKIRSVLQSSSSSSLVSPTDKSSNNNSTDETNNDASPSSSNNSSSLGKFHRLFMAFNALISRLIYEEIVCHVSPELKGVKEVLITHGNRQRAGSHLTKLLMAKAESMPEDNFLHPSSPLKTMRARVFSEDDVVITKQQQQQQQQQASGSPFRHDDNNTPHHHPPPLQSNEKTNLLMALLLSFVRLKESHGIERSLLSVFLISGRSPSNTTATQQQNEKEQKLYSDLVLEMENQRSIVRDLREKACRVEEMDNRTSGGYRSLQALVEQSLDIGPGLSELHDLIIKDFNLMAFRKAVTMETFWTLITLYIDRLHSLELLIIEEIKFSAAQQNNESLEQECQQKMELLMASSTFDKSEQGDVNNLFFSDMTAACTSPTPDLVVNPITRQHASCNNLLLAALGNIPEQSQQQQEPPITQTQAISQLKSMTPEEVKSYVLSLIESKTDNHPDTSSSSSDEPQRPTYNRRHSAPECLPPSESSRMVHSPEWEIDQYQVKFLKRIGRGVAGTTYYGHWRGEEVAIKVAAMTEMGLGGWEAEMRSLQRLHHPNIIRFLGFIQNESPRTNCLVLEYCNEGNLSRALERPTPGNFFSHVVKSMANGMAYLHERKILHRDIKPDNILLHGDLAGGKFTVKLTDFGLATMAQNQSAEHTAETGTYRYMAPEIIRHLSYSFKADVYSFAVVTWQLLTRESPFSDKVSQVEAAGMVALENARPLLPQGIPNSIADFIRTCWSEDPSLRPSFDEILVAFKTAEKALSPAEVVWIQDSDGHPVYNTDETTGDDSTDKSQTEEILFEQMNKKKSPISKRKMIKIKGLFNSMRNTKKYIT